MNYYLPLTAGFFFVSNSLHSWDLVLLLEPWDLVLLLEPWDFVHCASVCLCVQVVFVIGVPVAVASVVCL